MATLISMDVVSYGPPAVIMHTNLRAFILYWSSVFLTGSNPIIPARVEIESLSLFLSPLRGGGGGGGEGGGGRREKTVLHFF